MNRQCHSIKILQVLYDLRYGGSERLASLISYGLNSPPFTTMVLGVYGGGPLVHELHAHNIPYFSLDLRGPSAKGNLARKLDLNLFLYQLLKWNQIDIVQVHGAYLLAQVLLAARMAGCKVIYTEHAKRSLQTTFRLRVLTRIACLACNHTVVVSEDLKNYMESQVGISSKDLRVIYNGVDLGKFDCESEHGVEDVTLLRMKSQGLILVGVVARFTDAKDHHNLFHAWHLVVQRTKQLRLVLVGDGELREALTRTAHELDIADSICFLGHREDVPSIIRSMDLMVLPSKREGLPLTILECMAMNKPVIATTVGGVSEIIKHGFNGYLIPPQDPVALSCAILEYMTKRDAFRELAMNGRKTVQRAFSMEITLDRYAMLYHEVCGR